MQARLLQTPNTHVKIIFPPLLSRYQVSVCPATNSVDVSMFQRSAQVGMDGNFTIYRAPIRFRYYEHGQLYVYGTSYSKEEIEFAKNIIEIVVGGAGPIVDAIYDAMPLPLFEEIGYNYPAAKFEESIKKLLVMYKALVCTDAPFDICTMAQEWAQQACAGSKFVNPIALRPIEVITVKN